MSERILSQRELAEIAQRDKARTQGEWEAIYLHWESPDWGGIYVRSVGQTVTGSESLIRARDDTEFVAHCSTDIPRLLETVKALRELLAEAVDGLAQHEPGCLGEFYKDSTGAEQWPCKCGYRDWREAVTKFLKAE